MKTKTDNYFTLLISLFLFAVLPTFITACSNDDDEDEYEGSLIVGTWYYINNYTGEDGRYEESAEFTFFSDGTGRFRLADTFYDDDNVYFERNGKNRLFTFSFKQMELIIITDEEHEKMTYSVQKLTESELVLNTGGKSLSLYKDIEQ